MSDARTISRTALILLVGLVAVVALSGILTFQVIQPPAAIRQASTTTPTPTPVVKEFYIIADQWAFNETNPTITVNKGDTVKLSILSSLSQEDGGIYPGHGILITGYNIEDDLPVGTTTTLKFVADIPGEFNYLCSIYCGPDHGIMSGAFVVLG